MRNGSCDPIFFLWTFTFTCNVCKSCFHIIMLTIQLNIFFPDEEMKLYKKKYFFITLTHEKFTLSDLMYRNKQYQWLKSKPVHKRIKNLHKETNISTEQAKSIYPKQSSISPIIIFRKTTLPCFHLKKKKILTRYNKGQFFLRSWTARVTKLTSVLWSTVPHPQQLSHVSVKAHMDRHTPPLEGSEHILRDTDTFWRPIITFWGILKINYCFMVFFFVTVPSLSCLQVNFKRKKNCHKIGIHQIRGFWLSLCVCTFLCC